MAGKGKKQNSDVGSWVFIVILFAIGLWPIALIVLFFKLFGKDEKKKRMAPPPLERADPLSAQSGAQRESLSSPERPAGLPAESPNPLRRRRPPPAG